MTMNRLGVVLLSVIGLLVLWTALSRFTWFVFELRYQTISSALWSMLPTLLSGGLMGFVLLRWRLQIAEKLFGTEDVSVGSVSLLDAQATAICLLGAYFLADGIPELVRHVVWVPKPASGQLSLGVEANYPVGRLAADILKIVGGLVLLARCKELAHRFLPAASAEGAS